MNYNLDKHDVEIILDALETLLADVQHAEKNGHDEIYIWTSEEINGVRAIFDEENDSWDLK